jgi:glycosyltransferase involved in cell wall biosynthesis
MSRFSFASSLRPVSIPGLGREVVLARDLFALLKICSLIRRFRPHIVHTHTAKAGTLGRFAAILTGVPIRVHTFHGHVFHSYFGRAKSRLFLLVERWLARRTDRVVTLSPRLKEELGDRYRIAPPEKIAVLPLGFEIAPYGSASRFRGELRRELSLDSAPPLVGIVGRLAPVKNHRLFFRAAAILSRRFPEVRYIVVGDGPRRPRVEQWAEVEGLAEKTFFLGWRDDLPKIYSDLDLLVLSSLNEGTPLSILEAFASGLPVVSTEVGGVGDLFAREGPGGKSHEAPPPPICSLYREGILVPSGDAGGLADAMAYMLENPTIARTMGAHGARRVRAAHSAEHLARNVETLYTQLLREKGLL